MAAIHIGDVSITKGLAPKGMVSPIPTAAPTPLSKKTFEEPLPTTAAPAPAPKPSAPATSDDAVYQRAWTKAMGGDTTLRAPTADELAKPLPTDPALPPKSNAIPRPYTTAPTYDEVKQGAVLKRGHQDKNGGWAVKDMQEMLIRQGADIAADGKFGPKTEAALKKYTGRSTADLATLESLDAKNQTTKREATPGWDKLTGKEQKSLQSALDQAPHDGKTQKRITSNFGRVLESPAFDQLSPALRTKALDGLASTASSAHETSYANVLSSPGFAKVDAKTQSRLIDDAQATTKAGQDLAALVADPRFKKSTPDQQADYLKALVTTGISQVGIWNLAGPAPVELPAPKRRGSPAEEI